MSKRRIVIVGGGIAGKSVTEKLSSGKIDADIVLIDSREYMEQPFAQLRALTDPEGFGRTVRKNYIDLLPEVEFFQGAAASIEPDMLVLSDGRKVNYDILVLATGSSSRNWPYLNGSELTITERQETLNAEGAKLESAGRVLIIGGGAIGVELAGEIAEKWSGKDIQIVQGADRLLNSFSEKMSVRSEKVLSGQGVKISTGTKLSNRGGKWVDENGENYSADIVYQALGTDINTGWISGGVSIPKNENGSVQVSPDLRVIGQKNIFALGDINDVPELNQGAFASMQAEHTVKNIRRLLQNPDSSLKPYKAHSPVGLITLGSKLGAVQVPFGFPHFLIAVKQKDLFVGKYIGK